jgi:hypothetical protein
MSSNVPYRRIPTSDSNISLEIEEPEFDPRFYEPTPPWWHRALLILFIVVGFWVAWILLPVGKTPMPLDWDGE